jgi:hypothetical protein
MRGKVWAKNITGEETIEARSLSDLKNRSEKLTGRGSVLRILKD